MKAQAEYPLLQAFEKGEIRAEAFGHREHVQVAWEMLRSHPFLDAATRYSGCIESMARAAGVPGKFNLTITLSFLSLIAEMMAACPEPDFDRFYQTHPDLARNPLKRWYSDDRLDSDLARKVFLMPEPQWRTSDGHLTCR